MTYKTRPDTSADASPDLNRKRHFMSYGWYSLCTSHSMFLFILQHHYLVRMGHKMNASQLLDLFLPSFNSSLSCLQSLSVLSNFSRWFWILIQHACNLTYLNIQYSTVSFSLLYLLPETDHKAVTKSLLCLHPAFPQSLLMLSFSLYPSKKIKKIKRKRKTKTQCYFLICLGFF